MHQLQLRIPVLHHAPIDPLVGGEGPELFSFEASLHRLAIGRPVAAEVLVLQGDRDKANATRGQGANSQKPALMFPAGWPDFKRR